MSKPIKTGRADFNEKMKKMKSCRVCGLPLDEIYYACPNCGKETEKGIE